MSTKIKKVEEDKNEPCVKCGARTNYSKSEPTEHRYGYVESEGREGQFCFKCAYFGNELSLLRYLSFKIINKKSYTK